MNRTEAAKNASKAARKWRIDNPEETSKIAKKGYAGMIKKVGLNKILEAGKKQLLLMNSDKEKQSKAGKMCVFYENKGVEILKRKHEKIFRPSDVCDRLCVNNGKLIFAEIKQQGQKLRPKQQEFKEICDKLGIKYEIIFVERKVGN